MRHFERDEAERGARHFYALLNAPILIKVARGFQSVSRPDVTFGKRPGSCREPGASRVPPKRRPDGRPVADHSSRSGCGKPRADDRNTGGNGAGRTTADGDGADNKAHECTGCADRSSPDGPPDPLAPELRPPARSLHRTRAEWPGQTQVRIAGQQRWPTDHRLSKRRASWLFTLVFEASPLAST